MYRYIALLAIILVLLGFFGPTILASGRNMAAQFKSGDLWKRKKKTDAPVDKTRDTDRSD